MLTIKAQGTSLTNLLSVPQQPLDPSVTAVEPKASAFDDAKDDGKQGAACLTSNSKPASPQKIAASQKNGAKSKGPKTAAGKTISSWNAMKHGLLSQRLMKSNDEKAIQFSGVLKSLQQDLEPVGALEEILVEKIAYEYLRTASAVQYEGAESNLGYLSSDVLCNLVRYQSMINRQLFQAISELERQQRLRRGEDISAPVNLNISHDFPSVSDKNGS